MEGGKANRYATLQGGGVKSFWYSNLYLEVAIHRYLSEWVLLKISQNLPGDTSAGVSFLIKLSL